MTGQEQRVGYKEKEHEEKLPLPLREGWGEGAVRGPQPPPPNLLPQGELFSSTSSLLSPLATFRRRAGSAAIYAGYIIRRPGLPVSAALGRVAVAAADGGAVRVSATAGTAAPDAAAIAMCSSARHSRAYLLNSVKLVSATVLCGLAIAVPSAYALSRLRFRRPVMKSLVMLGMLAVQLISPLVIALPLYRWFSALGLIDFTCRAGSGLCRAQRAVRHLDAGRVPRHDSGSIGRGSAN